VIVTDKLARWRTASSWGRWPTGGRGI